MKSYWNKFWATKAFSMQISNLFSSYFYFSLTNFYYMYYRLPICVLKSLYALSGLATVDKALFSWVLNSLEGVALLSSIPATIYINTRTNETGVSDMLSLTIQNSSFNRHRQFWRHLQMVNNLSKAIRETSYGMIY